MRALVLSEFGRVEIQERPVPTPDADEVLLSVDACGICGSDVHGFLGEEPRRQPGLVLGHECVGRIAGGETPELPLGMRVAVNPLMPCGHCPACVAGRTQNCPTRRLIGLDEVQGAFADYTLVRRSNLFPLSPEVPDETACLIEPLACAVHLFALSPAPPLARTALFGGGTLGSMLLILAKRLGYGPVVVIEPNPGRREIALALGADEVVDPTSQDLAEAVGEVEITIDAVGVSAARQAAIRLTQPGGTVLLLGTNDQVSELEFRDLVRRELRLQASYGFRAADFARAKALVEAGAVDVRQWTKEYPLADGQTGFESMVPPPPDVLKVVLRPTR